MTYIQPNKNKTILNLVLGVVVCALFIGVFSLVTLYNNVVNVSQNIQTAKSKLDAIGAQNTSLNNQVVTALASAQTSNLGELDGLVADAHPQYFNQSWSLASQQ